MNPPSPSSSENSKSGPTSPSPFGDTVPSDAFSPDGLRAHLERTGPTDRLRRSETRDGTAPLLGRPSLIERLGSHGGRAVEPALPRFEVEGVLGVGATGRVYAVRDRNLARAVAVKFLDDSGGQPGPDAIAHFVDEAQITASLEHPNVLPVHELDVNEAGQVYFSMKKIAGRSLGALIEESTAQQRAATLGDVNALVNLFVGVCHALAYAHDRGIVHQDVKPSNIMVGDYGEVLLVDWGSAVRLEPGKQPRLYGTPLYMSPEQARRDGVDARSDIYCLGATLFHALTLRPPTWSDDADEFWRMKRAGEMTAPSAQERAASPVELLDIALKALAPAPGSRYRTVSELRDDLRGYQSGLAVSAHRDSLLEALSRWHRRHWRALWATAAVAAVVLALGATIYGEKLKEIATWGQPVMAEDFTDDSWKQRWHVVEGGFEQRAGRLVSTDTHANIVVWPHKLSGPTAVEYDGEILPGAHPCDISLVWARDIGEQGWPLIDRCLIQVGCFDGAYTALRADDYSILSFNPFRPAVGTRYHVRVEMDDYAITLWVDGRKLCESTDSMRLDGGYVALYGHYAGKAFDNVRIYSRGMAQKVPATAIGDTLVRLKQTEPAFDQYRKVAESHPHTTIGDEALYKQGLCRWQQKRYDEAESAWAALAGTAFAPQVTLHAIDRRFIFGDHPRALTALVDLYASSTPAIRKLVARQWGRYVDVLHRLGDDSCLESYVAAHDRYFPDQDDVEVNAAEALINLDRFTEVLERHPRQRMQCAWALTRLDRPHEVIERYADQLSAYNNACFLTGEFDLIDRYIDPALYALTLVLRGRAEEALAIPGIDSWGKFEAYRTLGRFDEAIAIAPDPYMRAEALCAAGRASEGALLAGRIGRSIGLLAAGDALGALGASEPGESADVQARNLLGLRCAISGDIAGARGWFDVKVNEHAGLDEILFGRFLAPFALGTLDQPAYEKACDDVIAAERWSDAQQSWYLAGFLRGSISEERFLAQPERRLASGRMLFLKAFMADRTGHAVEALGGYQAFAALPIWKRRLSIFPALDLFVEWRIDSLSAARR